MKVIIAPDKFKGSLKSIEACQAIREGLLLSDPTIETMIFPMADGGDGFAEVLKYYLRTSTQYVSSVDPLGRKIESSYEWNKQDGVAIIELAGCSGLAMLRPEERDPMNASTYGTGLQLKHAIDARAKKIILGLGGSATNDGGTGILWAMGFSFSDKQGNALAPCGKNLPAINKITPATSLPELIIEIACDVDNPLYGPEGAAFVFSPQKGASPAQVRLLDEGLKNFAEVIFRQTGKDISKQPGAGAAGGIAAGLLAFLNASITSGIELIIDASNIKNSLDNIDFIITGEGKIDVQTFHGKTISAIISMAREKNIPVGGICGKIELPVEEWKKQGLVIVKEIGFGMSREESMRRAGELVREKAREIADIFLR